MELHRKINPDWRFADPVPFLLAEIATIESDRRYLEVQRMVGADKNGEPNPVPDKYLPSRYGPPRESSDQTTDDGAAAEERDVERARQIAAEMS